MKKELKNLIRELEGKFDVVELSDMFPSLAKVKDLLNEDKTVIKCKLVHHHVVVDPDSGGDVTLSIVKLETGGIIGIDTSFLENTELPVYSPFDKNVELDLDF